jgi:hypothetical protein
MSAAPYHLAERGVGVGVLTPEEVEAGLATGRLSAATFSWREGEAGWVTLGTRPEFASAIGAFRALVPPPALAFEAGPLLKLGWTAWAQTLLTVWGSPRIAFRGASRSASLGRAFWWVLACATIAAPFLYVQLTLMGAATSSAQVLPGVKGVAPAVFDLGHFSAFFFPFPPTMAALVFGGACLLHAVLVLVGGGKGGFRATVRVVAYVVGAMLIPAVVPCAWVLFPFVVLGYLSASLRTAHQDVAWKASLALAVAGFGAACVAAVFMALAVRPFFLPFG